MVKKNFKKKKKNYFQDGQIFQYGRQVHKGHRMQTGDRIGLGINLETYEITFYLNSQKAENFPQ